LKYQQQEHQLVFFKVRERKEEEKKKVDRRQITLSLSTHAALEERGRDNASNDIMEEHFILPGGVTHVDTCIARAYNFL
jgi:hypothetical protein